MPLEYAFVHSKTPTRIKFRECPSVRTWSHTSTVYLRQQARSPNFQPYMHSRLQKFCILLRTNTIAAMQRMA